MRRSKGRVAGRKLAVTFGTRTVSFEIELLKPLVPPSVMIYEFTTGRTRSRKSSSAAGLT
jgi:hypothetical protein